MHPYTPPAPRRRSPVKTALIILTIVLGGLFVLAVGCTALVVHSAKQVEKNPEINAPKKAYALNQAAGDGKFTFTVTKATTAHHIGDSVVGSDAQGVFIVLDVTVTNHGTKPQMLDASSQRLIVGGSTYNADSGALTDSKAFLNNINPGNTVRASLAFDVPTGTTPADAQVVLHDSPFSNGVRVNLK